MKFQLLDGDVIHVIRDLKYILLLGNSDIKKSDAWELTDELRLYELGNNTYSLEYVYDNRPFYRLRSIGHILEWRGPYKVLEY